MFPSVNGIELVTSVKLLRVWIQDNVRAVMHVDYMLSLCIQRVFVMKRLCYGFSSKIECVDTLFDAACVELFHEMCSSSHCLHDNLPPASNQCYDMRQRANRFVLPQSIIALIVNFTVSF